MAYTRQHRETENSKEEFLRRTKQTINECVRLAVTDNIETDTLDEVRDERKGRGSSDRRRRHSDDYSSGSASDEDGPSYGRGSNRRHSPRDDSDEWSRDSSDRERPRNRSDRQSDKRRQRSPPLKHSDPPTPRYDDSPRYNDMSPRRKDPPPPPPLSRPQPLRGPKDKKRDDLHDELQQFMSKGSKGQKPQKERPQVKFINARSTVDDVANWLDTKGFSEKCIRVFRSYNGEDMFRMKRKEMDRLIGAQEAQRLESQILVLKNKEGYKTARSGGKELQAILQVRKEMADRKEDQSSNPEIADYSDSESDDSDNFENAGLTLRAMLRHQRKRISNSVYHD